MKPSALTTLAVVLSSFPLPIHAQGVQTNGSYGGDTACFAVNPKGAGGTNLFAGAIGGVFLSTNNGTTHVGKKSNPTFHSFHLWRS